MERFKILFVSSLVIGNMSWVILGPSHATAETIAGSWSALDEIQVRPEQEKKQPLIYVQVLTDEEFAKINFKKIIDDVYVEENGFREKFERRFACADKQCRGASRQPLTKCSTIGVASMYGRGDGFAGKLTASGERFNPKDKTAAHKTLPFGTRVRVINVNTNRSVVVRINDRGPYAAGRVIDLSTRAADEIGIGNGIGRVHLECQQSASPS